MFRKAEKRTILIMDDAPGIQKILTVYLQNEYELVVKSDGMEGMEWLDQGHTADLILADLEMPNLGGREFLQAVRASNFYKDIPVIILSAKSESGERIECLNKGADDFIEKPFNPVEVLAKIKVILKRYKGPM